VISYSTNWMGPINQEFINEYGSHWSGGRIDIYDVPGEDYPIEYSLPLMRTEDWNDFGDWLESFQTHELWEFDDIIKLYESASGRKIRWWKDD
jgi:hypothetical protein